MRKSLVSGPKEKSSSRVISENTALHWSANFVMTSAWSPLDSMYTRKAITILEKAAAKNIYLALSTD